MFPEGETVTLGFECEVPCFAPSWELVENVGEEAFPSVGVGGVMKVVGASAMFGGVAGSWVMIRLGAVERREVVDCVCSPVCICGGDAWNGSSVTFVSRFFPPKSEPNPLPLVLGLEPSGSPPVLGAVARRVGANASFSLPTGDGDTARFFTATSMVFECRIGASSAEVTESLRVASVMDPTESIVSEAIKGDDSVKSPACDWCGEMPGLFAVGGLVVG
jgi:hypothetical protein